MAKYLISFPAKAMTVTDAELQAAGRDSREVIREAKAAGVYVFAGGNNDAVAPKLVSADGSFTEGGYLWAPPLNGGFAVFELPSEAAAKDWASRLAKACRCQQELRVFMFDPES